MRFLIVLTCLLAIFPGAYGSRTLVAPLPLSGSSTFRAHASTRIAAAPRGSFPVHSSTRVASSLGHAVPQQSKAVLAGLLSAAGTAPGRGFGKVQRAAEPKAAAESVAEDSVKQTGKKKNKKEKVKDPAVVEALSKLEIGQTFDGTVAYKNEFGAFAYVGLGKLVKPRIMVDPAFSNKLKAGDPLKFKLISIDPPGVEVESDVEKLTADRQLLALSTLETGSMHTGHLSRFSPIGVFVDINVGVDGSPKWGRVQWKDWKSKGLQESELDLGSEVNVKVVGVKSWGEKAQFELELA